MESAMVVTNFPWLTVLVALPAAGAALLGFVSPLRRAAGRVVALVVSLLELLAGKGRETPPWYLLDTHAKQWLIWRRTDRIGTPYLLAIYLLLQGNKLSCKKIKRKTILLRNLKRYFYRLSCQTFYL